MSDAERQIIQLLTEIRDAQRDEIAYRREVLEESLALQKKAIGMQSNAVHSVRILLLLIALLGLLALLVIKLMQN